MTTLMTTSNFDNNGTNSKVKSVYKLRASGSVSTGGEGTNDYERLKNKPLINNVQLIGNKTLEDLNIQENMNITTEDITNWNNKSEFSGDYDDLSNKPTIPSSTSDLTNDSDFTTKTYVDSIVGDIETVLTTITTGGGVS